MFLFILLVIIMIIILICFIISGIMFHIALCRSSDKDTILHNDINGKVTEGKAQLPPPNIKWLDNHSKQIDIISYDNLKLHGYIVNRNNSDKWMILVHGYSSDHTSMINRGKKFYQMGFNILLVDLRGHGKSEGKYITMGVKDCQDIKKWIKYIVHKEKAKQIGLFGISMGAATVMMAIGIDLMKEVKFAIEDCGYTSVWDELKYQLKNLFHLPTFPFLYICELYAKIFAKYDFRSYSPVIGLKKAVVPVLLIHGTNDTFVPYYMLNENYEACKSKKDEFIVIGANHTEAEDLAYNDYWEKIENFIKKVKEL